MDWGWITIYAFAIFWAAGIAGGIVAFRGSSRSGIRGLAAASVASGILMWIVVLMVVLASVTSNGPGEPIVDVSGPAAQSLAK